MTEQLTATYQQRKQKLYQVLNQYALNDAVIAFSGGVDSCVLLKAASEIFADNRTKLHAVTFSTTLHPVNEISQTKKLAALIGVPHQVIEIDELNSAGIMNNPIDRCYLCKKYLFSELRKKAWLLDALVIMDGTNADDLHLYRPGLKALRELNIASPLAESGLTKEEVRLMAREYNLPVADKPSTPCLATRFPYNTPLSAEGLNRVAQGESFLHSLGFHNIRLRIHDNLARIELDAPDLDKAISLRETIISNLKALGYRYISLDIEGFKSGSMD